MNVGVIGLGKLGCSMLAVFASSGLKVFGYDINEKVRENLINNLAPVDETNLQEELINAKSNYEIKNSPIEVLDNSEILYVIVPTPSRDDGTFETLFLENVIKELSKTSKSCLNKTIVITSTVLPGDTAEKLKKIASCCDGPFKNIEFCYSPEFIALGTVINDLKNPDFLLIGEQSLNAGNAHIRIMKSIISNKEVPIRRMSIESAEMAKISINAYITSKISFANAIGIACEKIENCSSEDVLAAIGSDSRIGKKYLSKGLGFGGPCFPRDNRAIQQVINKSSINYSIPISNDAFNRKIPDFYSEKFKYICRKNKISTAILVGISYKDGSFLLEESQSYAIAESLVQNMEVFYFDPDVNDLPNKTIKKLPIESLFEEKVLVINCSRDKKKMNAIKNNVYFKSGFIEYDVWK